MAQEGQELCRSLLHPDITKEREEEDSKKQWKRKIKEATITKKLKGLKIKDGRIV